MKKRVAIVSASGPDNENTGMLTVDLAAYALRTQIHADEINWFTFPSFTAGNSNSFHHHVRHDVNFFELPSALPEMCSHDMIVYWGDFLQAYCFLQRSGPIQLKRLGLSEQATRDALLRCLFLTEEEHSTLQKTLLFAGTTISNSQADLLDKEYKAAFERLVKNCGGVWMRDPISAAGASLLRGGHESCLGTDAALLLSEADHPPPTDIVEENEPEIGVFVGARSLINKHVETFIESLSGAFGCRIDWLPWLKQKSPPTINLHRKVKNAAKLLVGSNDAREHTRSQMQQLRSGDLVSRLRERTLRTPDRHLGNLLSRLAKYRFIISDTYHVCVNAWRLGVPAVCLTSQTKMRDVESGSLNELKKQVLFSLYMASDFIYSVDELSIPSTTDRVIDTLRSGQGQMIAKRIATHASSVQTDFLRVLNEQLDTTTVSCG